MKLDFQHATNNIINDTLISELKSAETVIIWGAGLSGQYVYDILCDYNIEVICFVDMSKYKQGTKLFGKMVYSFEDAIKKYSHPFIVIASMWYEEIKEYIEKYSEEGLCRFCNGLSTMNWETVNKKRISDEPEYISKNIEYFEWLSGELCDYESRQTLENLLNYRLTRNIDYLSQIKSNERIYVDKTIITDKIRNKIGNRAIIDAGAFDGDTIPTLSECFSARNRYYCYEISDDCIRRLKQKKEIIFNDLEISVIQKALWSKSNIKLGINGEELSGRVGEGDRSIESITIDDSNLDPLGFVKMDIEGAEREALEGGQNTIQRDKPVLAICSYHLQDDLIELPRIIKSINDEYRFYLRHYMLSSGDTILYAIPD